jgi:hypothetical protein
MDTDRTDAGFDDAGFDPAIVARYRRVLSLLPRRYRRHRGEELLAVMLDMARDEGRERPTLAETCSIIGLSVRSRGRGPLGVIRRLRIGRRSPF